jgi:hypothetical protein
MGTGISYIESRFRYYVSTSNISCTWISSPCNLSCKVRKKRWGTRVCPTLSFRMGEVCKSSVLQFRWDSSSLWSSLNWAPSLRNAMMMHSLAMQLCQRRHGLSQPQVQFQKLVFNFGDAILVLVWILSVDLWISVLYFCDSWV